MKELSNIYNTYVNNEIDFEKKLPKLVKDLINSKIYKSKKEIINDIAEYFSKNIEHDTKPGYLYCLSNETYEYYGTDIYKLGRTCNLKNRKNSYITP